MTAVRMILPAALTLFAAGCLCPPGALAHPAAQSPVTAGGKSAAKAGTMTVAAAAKKKGVDANAAVDPSEPTLLGQYQDWGAYVATPGGKKVCFALAKPKSQKASKDDVKRDPAYMFIATRPAEKVKNEISVIIGYPLKPNEDALAEVGDAKFAMFTQNDGAWIKNAAEEPQMIEAMRKGSDMTVKGTSSRGTQTTDTYSLMGISNALERVAKECGSS